MMSMNLLVCILSLTLHFASPVTHEGVILDVEVTKNSDSQADSGTSFSRSVIFSQTTTCAQDDSCYCCFTVPYCCRFRPASRRQHDVIAGRNHQPIERSKPSRSCHYKRKIYETTTRIFNILRCEQLCWYSRKYI